jgi:hypothetical protein
VKEGHIFEIFPTPEITPTPFVLRYRRRNGARTGNPAQALFDTSA